MNVLCIKYFKLFTMLSTKIKKEFKSNSYKAVRESLKLNHANSLTQTRILSSKVAYEIDWVYAFAEINLLSNIQTQKEAIGNSFVVKWWEN